MKLLENEAKTSIIVLSMMQDEENDDARVTIQIEYLAMLYGNFLIEMSYHTNYYKSGFVW